MKQDVRPIKNLSEIKRVLKYLKNYNEFGIRNFMMFSIGMNCVLRISDIVNLKYSDVYTNKGKVKKYLRIREIKTGKIKELLLIHAKNDLVEYKRWLDNFINSQPDKYMAPLKNNEKMIVGTGKNAKEVNKNDYWLFPSSQHPTQHVSEKTFYKAMKQVSKATGVEHLGTHTPRKTGAYLFYRGGFDDVLRDKDIHPSNDIALAMKTLNHSSEGITLNYLGLEQESINQRVAENSAFNINI
ncbi:site-specific integrase [Apilactobacillus micheneri]|uniref:tyrosine-type recombinase/integrase n=2 Tax=Apilactobacillus micheneri TaxID=1899430 RepID=UPI00112ACFB2|nr:tyrosine-type recombinase/integrase [Apilactobacillus micheneri]TPR41213.1 site-specific integrase [Apilactobacillus micheneri]